MYGGGRSAEGVAQTVEASAAEQTANEADYRAALRVAVDSPGEFSQARILYSPIRVHTP
jgi:hypothetical protein